MAEDRILQKNDHTRIASVVTDVTRVSKNLLNKIERTEPKDGVSLIRQKREERTRRIL